MSVAELKRLQEALRSAPEEHLDLTRDVAAANDLAGLAAVLGHHGYVISKRDLENPSLSGELSTEQLDDVAGGIRSDLLTRYKEIVERVLGDPKKLNNGPR